jgi:hypothetical protein
LRLVEGYIFWRRREMTGRELIVYILENGLEDEPNKIETRE